jgi:hypothetical protein
VKERPINLRDEEVRAILDGRQTQLRRPVELPISKLWEPNAISVGVVTDSAGMERPCLHALAGATYVCSVVPGNRLWGRECHQIATGHMFDGEAAVRYRADGAIIPLHDARSNEAPRSLSISGRWHSSVHMPRWASRMTLRVTDVRVERLKDITRDDTLAEGVYSYDHCMGYPQAAFADSWDRTYAKRGLGWDANPWTWVYSFEREDGDE